MKQQDAIEVATAESNQAATSEINEALVPVGLASGLYATSGLIPGLTESTEEAGEDPQASAPLVIPGLHQGEELRLDVDGRYRQMTASGTVPISKVQRLHWVASLQVVKPNLYTGGIWYKDPAVSPFAYSQVSIKVTKSILPGLRKASVTFSGGGLPKRVRIFHFRSPYFHKVRFEFDAATGITPDTTFDTSSHPNRPATLPNEVLTIENVFRRAGFDISRSGDSVVPLAGAGANAQWSNTEMHDAMKVSWSRFADKAQWAMWTFFANQHEMGPSLGGIMFDDIGPNERQGTSLFYNSFISNPPAGDPNGAAHVKRMHFWTAVHEMGHAFNLAHSWQKSLGVSWIPLADEPEARSFMNYPYNVNGGQTAFFADFEYRFSNPELLFTRHAPSRFVEMGNAAWFDNHGFKQAAENPEPKLALELRANRKTTEFEFLEPVVAELKLKNISTEPQLVDEHLLTTLNGVTIVMKKQGKPARQYVPYAQLCMQAKAKALNPGESMYESVFLSAGLNGMDLSEPGYYVLQACLHRSDGDVLSLPLVLRISPPRGYEEEYLAQDFFTDDVGRVLAFDGSRVLGNANDTLRAVSEKLGDRRVALHALVALGRPARRDGKVLQLENGVRDIGQKKGQPDQAKSELTLALTSNPDRAAESLGHIDYKVYIDMLTDFLSDRGERKEAAQIQDTLQTTLLKRGVIARVIDQVNEKKATYAAKAARA